MVHPQELFQRPIECVQVRLISLARLFEREAVCG
jgi:hypothetical protein